MTPAWMVFDVESAGLSGEGFAVGWVVVARDGTEIDSGMRWCQLALASGREKDIAWVREHVMPALAAGDDSRRAVTVELRSLVDLRTEFWSEWGIQRARGAVLAADVPWPVEANFLSACVRDNPRREVTQPYPLIDIASVRLAAGFDPLATLPRTASELPAHNPLADARQSARLLVEAMAKLAASSNLMTR